MQSTSHPGSRIIPCPDCRVKFEELQEEILRLKDIISPKEGQFLSHVHFTSSDRKLLDVLNLHRGRLVRNSLIADYCNWTNLDRVKVAVCLLRKHLIGEGFHIETEWGSGYILREGEAIYPAYGHVSWGRVYYGSNQHRGPQTERISLPEP